MQIDRLFEIVHILLYKKTTAKELAERFGVSKRTILRDIDTLSVAGVPVTAQQGKGGGIAILDGYILDKTYLSEEERSRILLGLKTLAPTGESDEKGLLFKLGAMFAGTDTSWIDVDFSRWGSGAFDREKFEELKRAITGRQALQFTYVSSDGRFSERVVHPLKLIYKHKAWYLQAYCPIRQDYRLFKLNRMSQARRLAERFDGRMYAPPRIDDAVSSALILIKADFLPSAANRVFDEFSLNEITRNADGSLRLETLLPSDDWICGYFLSFGADVRIIEPQELRRALVKKAQETVQIYSEK